MKVSPVNQDGFKILTPEDDFRGVLLFEGDGRQLVQQQNSVPHTGTEIYPPPPLICAVGNTETDSPLRHHTQRIDKPAESLNLQAAAKVMEDGGLLMGPSAIMGESFLIFFFHCSTGLWFL